MRVAHHISTRQELLEFVKLWSMLKSVRLTNEWGQRHHNLEMGGKLVILSALGI
jgi:hypothetical protein